MSDYLDINNEELLKDFFSEAEQQVENLESNILVIETDPTNHEAIDEIFRAAHTLKGGSATVEMHELSGFTHVVEDLLDALRSNNLQVTEDVVNILLSSIDVIKAMLAARAEGTIYGEDVEPLKETLRSLLPQKDSKKSAAKPAPAKAASAPKVAVSVPPPVAQTIVQPVKSTAVHSDSSCSLSEYELLELKQACSAGQKLWAVTVVFDENNPMNSVGGIQVFAVLKEHGTVLKTVPDFDVLFEDEFQAQVVYYVATSKTADELEDIAFLDDVTLSTDARNLDNAVGVQSDTFSASLQSQTPKAVPESAPIVAVAPIAVAEAHHVSDQQAAIEEADSLPEADVHVSPEKLAAPAAAPKKAAPAPSHGSSGGSVLRVDSKRIDYLLNLVSETVITKAAFNQVNMHIGELQVQFQTIGAEYKEKIRLLFERLPKYLDAMQEGVSAKEIKAQINAEFGMLLSMLDPLETNFKSAANKFRSATQNLGRITGELQEGVMKIRMVPISQIFSRFPRVVRDLSRDLDKKINLVIEGEDTELDKSVIEDLLDPIMHCVRNSLDHGIETPALRAEAGKPEEGVLLLKASNEGNMIVIDISDDGKGIDVNAVRNKAIERGLIHPSKILTDHEAFQLIFEAGFSTAAKVSSVSGRGVGLDVVKTQIEKLNGSVMVTSERGLGSKFSIRLPLTLAIIQGLLVRVGSEVYSIPIASVIESHRVRRNEISTIDNYEVFNVRNEVISVLRLDRLFGLKTSNENEYSFIVIVGTADKKIGVMVDALIGEEDVVIKPLRDQFTDSPGIAGASILGDGSVSLIIDVNQLLELGVKQELHARQEREASIW